jgi:hypothetical protein
MANKHTYVAFMKLEKLFSGGRRSVRTLTRPNESERADGLSSIPGISTPSDSGLHRALDAAGDLLWAGREMFRGCKRQASGREMDPPRQLESDQAGVHDKSRTMVLVNHMHVIAGPLPIQLSTIRPCRPTRPVSFSNNHYGTNLN